MGVGKKEEEKASGCDGLTNASDYVYCSIFDRVTTVQPALISYATLLTDHGIDTSLMYAIQ